jgi:molybdate transport system ATP-binding protein
MLSIAVQKKLNSSKGEMILDVNLEIETGAFVSVFGPSGAGKTSLLRMIAGLLKPDKGLISCRGELWFDSHLRINQSPQNRKTGFVFQDYALFPNMTVWENLQFVIKEKSRSEYALELLNRVRLERFKEHYPDTLSGGQKQRIALIRAIVSDPEILLLDEPLSALDATNRLELQEDILKLHRDSGLTTILISHNSSEVYRMSDYVYGLEDGRINKHGKPDQFFSGNDLSGKIQIPGEIVDLTREDIVFLAKVICGNSLHRVILTVEEAKELKIGDNVLIVAKAFNPILLKIS